MSYLGRQLSSCHRILVFNQIQVTQRCSLFTRPSSKKLKERKEKLDQLAKLDPKDRSVLGSDGTTLFFPVVRCPHIIPIVTWSKFKILTCYLSLSAVAADQIFSLGFHQAIYGVLGCSSFTLLFFGEFLRRTLGFVYLSEDESRVRISRISFFGNRRNFELDLVDIDPLTETGVEVKSEVWKVNLDPDCPTAKKLGRTFYVVGGAKSVVNPQKFNTIFGEVLDVTDGDGGGDGPAPTKGKL